MALLDRSHNQLEDLSKAGLVGPCLDGRMTDRFTTTGWVTADGRPLHLDRQSHHEVQAVLAADIFFRFHNGR